MQEVVSLLNVFVVMFNVEVEYEIKSKLESQSK